MERKASFTVRLKDDRDWISARPLNQKLSDFVAEVQRNARLLHLIDDDEIVVRLKLPGHAGSKGMELDVDSTLGDVKICMGDLNILLIAVIEKLPPPPPPSPVVDIDTPTKPIPPGTLSELDPRASREKGQPSSSSSGLINSPAVAPRQVDAEPPERSVVIKRRFDHDIRVTAKDLTSNPHLTLLEKAESLSISLTALKSARGALELGRWMGRQERARIRRHEGPSQNTDHSPAAAAEDSVKRAKSDGHGAPACCCDVKSEH